MKHVDRSRFLCVLAAAAATICVTGPVYAAGCYQAPYSCYPQGDVNPDTPPDYASRYAAYADFAWQDFLALNFPALQIGNKFVPEPSPTNGLNYGGGLYRTVWSLWAEATDLFQPGAAAPPAFGSGHILPAACVALKAKVSPRMVLRRKGAATLTDSLVLSEYIQANRMGPVIDRNGQYVRYGLNFNGTMQKYITDNTLYSVEGQLAFDANNPNRDKLTVKFPRGNYNGGQPPADPGSMFVKSSWKILGPGDNQASFHRASAFVYEQAGGAFNDEPTVTERCEVREVGLVGFHIVHFTNSAPQWVWSTFEHRDNAPWLADFAGPMEPARNYSFFNLQTCPPANNLPSCQFDVLPQQPWNPQVPGQVPTSLVRIAAPGQYAILSNIKWRNQLNQAYGIGKTVWANYYLTDVQFPTNTLPSGINGTVEINPAYPDGVPSPSFLANSTLETYIEGFHFGEKTTNSNVIPPDDQMVSNGVAPVDPWAPRVYNRSGGAERITSSCVSCHADATMTTGSGSSLVFSLSRAQKTAPPGKVDHSKFARPLTPEEIAKARGYLARDAKAGEKPKQ